MSTHEPDAVTFMDANQADDYAALMRQARDIQGMTEESDATREQAATEEFMAWVLEGGMRGSLSRELTDGGEHRWILRIQTGRGNLERPLSSPLAWRDVMKDYGLDA